ncbi:MAG: hypothetical protein ABIJ47_05660 [Candidatus Bathyarchaeota archaeon]
MTGKKVLAFLIIMFLGGLTRVHTVTMVKAASFDGVYNYAYNLNGPSGWETRRVNNGFIVRSGVVSSDPPALSGTVDSAGNVRFTGPSPYGGGSATFSGAIKSDGTGEGTYVDGQGLAGRWSVQRVSGGGTSWPYMILDIMNMFSFIGEAIGFTGTTASAVGTAVVVFAAIMFISIVTTVASKKHHGLDPKKRGRYISTGEYLASEPDAPSGEHGVPPSTIGVPPPPVNPPMGVGNQLSGLPDNLNLRANWDNRRVLIEWGTSSYDRSKYQLYGYEVTRLYYDGSGNTPRRLVVDQLAPESRSWTGPFNQTYRWNTGGDIQGYRVDAVFRDIASDQPRFVRVGETTYAPIS